MVDTTFGPYPPNRYFYQSPQQRRPSGQGLPAMSQVLTVPMYVNAAYYPSWHIYKNRPPSSLTVDALSHIFYAFAHVKPDGTVHLGDDWADSQIEVDGTRGCLRACSALRKQPSGIPKVILSVGGGGKGSDNFAAVASKPETRTRFAETARQLVLDYNIDGIDVDWEHPSTPQEGQYFALLLATLRSYLPMPRFWLTAALPAAEWVLKNIPLGQIAQSLNFINVMAYDFSGPWLDTAGHQSQLFSPPQPHNDAARISCHSAISYFISQGVHSKQLVLGIPAYGRSFLRSPGVGHRYSGHGGDEGTFEYRDLPRPGTVEQVDATIGAAYCVGGDGGFVTYDNVATVRMKAKYVKQNNLQGLFYWTGTGDAPDSRSLIYNGFDELHCGR